MKILALVGTVGMLLCQSVFGQNFDEAHRERLINLASDLDLDWLKESDQLIADGSPTGDVYEALLSRFCIAEDVDCLVSILYFMKDRGIQIPFGEKRLFATEELLNVFINGLEAIDAYRWKRYDEMRAFSQTCFQQNPSAFAMLELREVLEDARDEQFASKSTVKLPLDIRMKNVDGQEVTLGELCANNKAVYLDFWASWCGPCLRSMPELKKRAEEYSKLGIYVAAINTDDVDPEGKAKKTKKEYEMDIPWLIEPEDEPFSKALRIDSIPRVIMLDPSGQVIYNGHPNDAELKVLLLNLSRDS
jgi:thiol-disulfide isomerase/thioredoxin